MVFTLSSNEHTIKVVLNSKMASNTSIPYSPKFILGTPINTPHNVVGMVCLESCIITPPSLFTTAILEAGTNRFDRYILDANNAVIGNPQNYWSDIGGANRFQIGTAGGPDFDNQTNLLTIQFLMGTAKNLDLTVAENLSDFLCTFLLATRCFTLTLPYLPGDSQVAGGCRLSWQSTPLNNPNLGSITAPAECFNTGGKTWGTAGTHAEFTIDMLVTRLKRMSHVTFTLGCNANLNVGGTTTEFRLAGKWLKFSMSVLT